MPVCARHWQGLSCQQAFDDRSKRITNRLWTARLSINIDVNEEGLGGGFVFALRKGTDFITHRGISDFGDTQANVDNLRESQRGKIPAPGFHDQANLVSVLNVQHACLDQIAVHSRVQQFVIDDIVQMPVGIVIVPARGDLEEHRVFGPLTARRTHRISS